MDHSNVQSQKLHVQNQRRGYTAEENGTEEEEEDDSLIADPQYEYFLENLRPDGKYYVLDIIEDNIFVKYPDESSTPEAVTDCEIENANHVSNACMVDTEIHAPANYEGKSRGRKSKGPKLNADKNGSGSVGHVASEAQKHEGNHTGKRRGRKPKGQKLSTDKSPNGSTSSNNYVASEPQRHVHNHKGKHRGKKPKGSLKLHATKNPNGNSNHVASEAHKHAGKHRVKRAKKNVVRSAVETACFSQTEGQNFDHVTKVNHTDTPPCIATGVKEEIEDYDDDAPPIRRPVQDPVLNVEHFWDDDEANARKLTKYREKLMEELKMPYCKEEYERLLKDITVRKPVQREKLLRGRTKIYDEDYDGKSLLDHHIDLKKKIDSARDDHPKVLNLLRGFFYWLMNLSHEGAFMPWREPSCLDVQSQQ